MPHEQRPSKRIQVCLARKLRRQRRELRCGREQQRQRVWAMPQRKRGPRTHNLDLSALELVQRSLLGRPQQRQRCIGRSSPLPGLRRGQSTLGSSAGLRCQRNRAFQECGRSAEPGASLRTAGQPLELGGNLFVWPKRSMCAVPCATIGISLRIRGACKRAMYIPPLVGPRGVVDRRTKQRMTERDSCADSNQAGSLRRDTRIDRNTKLGSGSPKKYRIADRFGGGDEQQALRLLW
jgi:hypothetical protein